MGAVGTAADGVASAHMLPERSSGSRAARERDGKRREAHLERAAGCAAAALRCAGGGRRRQKVAQGPPEGPRGRGVARDRGVRDDDDVAPPGEHLLVREKDLIPHFAR